MSRRLGSGVLGALVLGAALVAAAQEEPPPASPPPPAQVPAPAQLRPAIPAAVSAESEAKLRAAFDHVYNLEFAPAREQFEQVAHAEPSSATVRAFWASALLYEILAYQGSLQTQLFVTSNEFLKHQRLPPDPHLDQRFHAVVREGLELARRRLKADPQDVDGLFAAGLLNGALANYAAGVKAKYLEGLRLGERSYNYHKRLRALHPELHDTGVVLGVHDYILGSLPRVHRVFLFFAGVRGSRPRGLGYFEETAEKGEFLATYARILLAVASIREGQLDRAQGVVETLRVRYPRNPIYALELAKLYRQQQNFSEAARVGRELLADLIAHPHNPRIVGPEDALLELGLIEDAEGQPERALETLAQVEKVPEVNKRIWARAVLERGKIFDRLGQRDLALAEYQKVIDLAAYPEVTRLAQAFRKKPYQSSPAAN